MPEEHEKTKTRSELIAETVSLLTDIRKRQLWLSKIEDDYSAFSRFIERNKDAGNFSIDRIIARQGDTMYTVDINSHMGIDPVYIKEAMDEGIAKVRAEIERLDGELEKLIRGFTFEDDAVVVE